MMDFSKPYNGYEEQQPVRQQNLTPQQELDVYQEKMDRILDALIVKMDIPLLRCEEKLANITHKFGIIIDDQPLNARTGRAQEIYAIVHRAEQIQRAIGAIDSVMHGEDPNKEDTKKKKGLSSLSYNQLKIAEDQGAYKEARGLDYDRGNKEWNKQRANILNEYDGPAEMRHGQFTEAGIFSQTSMANSKKNKKDPEDMKPLSNTAAVKLWNSKYPMKLVVTIPHRKYFQGEAIKLQTELNNQSPQTIKELEATLVRRTISYTMKDGQKKEHNKKDKSLTTAMLIPTGYPVPARMEKNAVVEFKLPFKLKATSESPDGTFELKYLLYVRATVNGHTSPTCCLPLRIVEYVV